MGFNIEGITGGDVKADGNGNLDVVLPTTITQAGYGALASRMDAGSVTGSVLARWPAISNDHRLAAGTDTALFDYAFNATAQNINVFKYVFANALTSTMGGGTLLMNSASTLTAAAGCQLTTFRSFALLGSGGLVVEFVASFTELLLANQVIDLGLFPHNTGVAAPLDGAYFRYTSAGLFGYVNFNGVETPTGTSIATCAVNQNYSFRIVITQRQTDFWRDDVLLGSIVTPAGNGTPFMTETLPASMQFRNTGLVVGSPVPQCKIAALHVDQRDVPLITPRPTQLTGMGAIAAQGQSGGTLGSTAFYANNLVAGAGIALSNTIAAIATGLGGQFTALPTLTAGTDGIICAYQNPAGSINQAPRILFITGVRIQGAVTTVLTGGPVLYAYSLAYGHTTVSMATADTASFQTATAKAPRRIPLGYETYAAAAAAGVLGSAGINVPFTSPVPVQPGEFIAVCAKNLGTVATLGAISILIGFDGYYE